MDAIIKLVFLDEAEWINSQYLILQNGELIEKKSSDPKSMMDFHKIAMEKSPIFLTLD